MQSSNYSGVFANRSSSAEIFLRITENLEVQRPDISSLQIGLVKKWDFDQKTLNTSNKATDERYDTAHRIPRKLNITSLSQSAFNDVNFS